MLVYNFSTKTIESLTPSQLEKVIQKFKWISSDIEVAQILEHHKPDVFSIRNLKRQVTIPASNQTISQQSQHAQEIRDKHYNSFKLGLVIKKNIKYKHRYMLYSRYAPSDLNRLKPTFIMWNIPGTFQIIPVKIDIKFEKIEKREKDVDQGTLDNWEHFKENATFLYNGKSRGLYEKKEGRVSKLRNSITKGDVVIVTEPELHLTNGGPPSKFKYHDNIELLKTKDNEVVTFQYIEQVPDWQTSKEILGFAGDVQIICSSSKQRLPDNTKDTIYLAGWLHVLAGGTHGWMKITQKSMKSLEDDFIKESDPRWNEMVK